MKMDDVIKHAYYLWVLQVVWTVSNFLHPAVLWVEASPIDKVITKRTGSDVTLRCPITRHHRPRVEWLKNGRRLETYANLVWKTERGQRLTLVDLSAEDAGVYRCRLPNNRRHGWSVTLDIVSKELKDDPAPRIGPGSLVNTTAVEGSTVVLECAVKSRYLYSVRWYRGKHDNLKANPFTQRRRQKNGQALGEKREDNLTLRNVTFGDTGWHTCVVRTQTGLIQQSAWLQVLPDVNREQRMPGSGSAKLRPDTIGGAPITPPSNSNSTADAEATYSRSKSPEVFLRGVVYAVALSTIIVLVGIASFVGLGIYKARRRADVVLQPYNLK